jgi:hypothetical protein
MTARGIALAALLSGGCSLLLIPPAPPRRTPPEPVRCGSRLPVLADALLAVTALGLGVLAVRHACSADCGDSLTGVGALLIGEGLVFGVSSAIGFERVGRCRGERERYAEWAAGQPPSDVVGELGGPCGAPASRWEAGSCRGPLACDAGTFTCRAP